MNLLTVGKKTNTELHYRQVPTILIPLVEPIKKNKLEHG